MPKPLLSIAIPTYNRDIYLKKNLSALLPQFRRELEIIVSDNASTDNTTEVVEEFIEQGLPIKYLRNKTNLGWAGNFQNCYLNASAEYIMILGDDDIIVPEGINIILDILGRADCDVLYCETYGFSKDYLKERPGYNRGRRVFTKPDRFLLETILNIRQISAIIIRAGLIDQSRSITGNFAHLHNIFTAIQRGKNFIALRDPIIACMSNNSGFDNRVNFSDVYVNEFFSLFREYFSPFFTPLAMKKIENKMLLSYYPIYVYKIRVGFLRKDTNMQQNFEAFFHHNKLYSHFLKFVFTMII